MVHTRSQIYSMLFTDAGNGFYNCTTFGKQYKKGIGYTNLPNHLRCSHEDYEQEAQEAVIKQYTVLKPRLSATATIVNNTNLEQDWSSYSAERR
ncbi:hypothetical protein PC111_g6684 [Phytophthora cactorum]|nr:hypothetical protein PC111_g6684 [Phytophthora cactorum]